MTTQCNAPKLHVRRRTPPDVLGRLDGGEFTSDGGRLKWRSVPAVRRVRGRRADDTGKDRTGGGAARYVMFLLHPCRPE